jgi:hypothetical protein
LLSDDAVFVTILLILACQVSPDGQRISYLRPSPDKDVLNVWVRNRQAAGAATAANNCKTQQHFKPICLAGSSGLMQ